MWDNLWSNYIDWPKDWPNFRYKIAYIMIGDYNSESPIIAYVIQKQKCGPICGPIRLIGPIHRIAPQIGLVILNPLL